MIGGFWLVCAFVAAAFAPATQEKITENGNVGKDNFTETVNFFNLREKSGLTLAQLAALSGYSVAAINGLELNNAGSARLREKLKAILTENVNRSELQQQVAPVTTPAPPSRLEIAVERIAAALERLATAAEARNQLEK